MKLIKNADNRRWNLIGNLLSQKCQNSLPSITVLITKNRVTRSRLFQINEILIGLIYILRGGDKMELRIQMNLDNAAFQGPGGVDEVKRILFNLNLEISHVQGLNPGGGNLRDYNGNTVGRWAII